MGENNNLEAVGGMSWIDLPLGLTPSSPFVFHHFADVTALKVSLLKSWNVITLGMKLKQLPVYIHSQVLWYQREWWFTNVFWILTFKMKTLWFKEVNDLPQVIWPTVGATKNGVQVSSSPGPLVVVCIPCPTVFALDATCLCSSDSHVH